MKTNRPGTARKRVLLLLCAFAAAFLIPARAQAATTVTASTTTWSGGEYAVSGNVTISSRVEVSGNVTLTLTAPKGVHVGPGDALTIRGTSGRLLINDVDDGAGIGGNDREACGNIVISGGNVTVTGSYGCAGIGNGNEVLSGGSITISGGTVNATGGGGAAALGGGGAASSASVTVTGGSITATAGSGAAAVSAGQTGSGTVSVRGVSAAELASGSVTVGGGFGASLPNTGAADWRGLYALLFALSAFCAFVSFRRIRVRR